MSALVKTIKSRLTDDTIYPVTKADAVYMGSSTVTTVEGQINDLKDIVGNSSLPSVNDTITSLIGSEAMGTTATTITGAIAQHEQDINTLNNKIVTERKSATITSSIATHVGQDFLFDVTKTGYTPIGIIEINKTGGSSGYLTISRFFINSTNRILVNVYNNYSSAVSNITVTINVLYIKS